MQVGDFGFAQVNVERDLQAKVLVDNLGCLPRAMQRAGVERRKDKTLPGKPLPQLGRLLATKLRQVGIGAQRTIHIAVRLPVAGEKEF